MFRSPIAPGTRRPQDEQEAPQWVPVALSLLQRVNASSLAACLFCGHGRQAAALGGLSEHPACSPGVISDLDAAVASQGADWFFNNLRDPLDRSGCRMTISDADNTVEKAVRYLESRLPCRPRVGLVLGSGLGLYADRHPAKAVSAYEEIPGFVSCSTTGHRGWFVQADVCGIPVAILQGRSHHYEGHSLQAVTRPIRVLHRLGIDTLIVTCAAGALTSVPVGDVLLIEDHLNLTGDNPLIAMGSALPGGSPFVEMVDAYDPALLLVAERVAKAIGMPVHRGVLACLPGPSYETRAEAAMLRTLGAHAVSMSTVPEVIVARALGIRVVGFALITNQAGAPLNRAEPHQQVLSTGESKADTVGLFLDGLLESLAIESS